MQGIIPSGPDPPMPEMTGAPSITTEQVDGIFDACDADRSNDLDLSEAKYALQAFGFYPRDEDIEKKVGELHVQFPLDKPSFRKLVGAVETSGCMRGLLTVPYSWRGLEVRPLGCLGGHLLFHTRMVRLQVRHGSAGAPMHRIDRQC